MGLRVYGWRPSSLDHRDFIYEPTITTLPVEVDLRPENPPIYDQGQLGSCTANAIAAHLDFNRHKQGEAFIEPSRLFIYYNERLHDGTVTQDAGSTIRESVQAVKTYGACPETEWPYVISQFTKSPASSCYTDATKYEDLTYLRVNRTVNDMKSCLAEGFPFVIGISVYESFEGETASKTGIIPMPSKSEQVLGGHALCVVGYITLNKKSYWIFRNSWGTSWGSSGYGFLPQAYLMNSGLSSDFWTLRKVS